MRCRKVKKELVEYLCGELSPGKAGKAEAHLKVCERCSAEKKRLSGAIELLKRKERPARESAFWQEYKRQVMARLPTKNPNTFLLPVIRPAIVGAMAALIVMVLGAGYLLKPKQPQFLSVKGSIEEEILAELSGMSLGEKQVLQNLDMELTVNSLEQSDQGELIISLAQYIDLERVVYSDETLTRIMWSETDNGGR